MPYKIGSKSNYFNPQVPPGTVIDDDGNIFLNDLRAFKFAINKTSPVIGDTYSFTVGGGGWAGTGGPSVANPSIPTQFQTKQSGFNSTPAKIMDTGPYPSQGSSPTGNIIAPFVPPAGTTNHFLDNYQDDWPGFRYDFEQTDTIEKFPYTTPGNATDVSELANKNKLFAVGSQSESKGFVSGGAANNVTFDHHITHFAYSAAIKSPGMYPAAPNPFGSSFFPFGPHPVSTFLYKDDLATTNTDATHAKLQMIDSSNNQSRNFDIYIGRSIGFSELEPGPGNIDNTVFPGLPASPGFQNNSLNTMAPRIAIQGEGTNTSLNSSSLVAGEPITIGAVTPFTAPKKPYTTIVGNQNQFGPNNTTLMDRAELDAANTFMWELVPYNGDITDSINAFPFAIGPVGSQEDSAELSFAVVKAGGHSSEEHGYVSGGAIQAFPNPVATVVPANVDYPQTKYGYNRPGISLDSIGQSGPFSDLFAPPSAPPRTVSLDFVTEKIQRFPFAISSGTAEEVGSLGYFASEESQAGRVTFSTPYLPGVTTPEITSGPFNVDGRAIYYGRFGHGSASSQQDGFIIAGNMAAVVYNQPGNDAAAVAANNSLDVNYGAAIDYRIMMPANFPISAQAFKGAYTEDNPLGPGTPYSSRENQDAREGQVGTVSVMPTGDGPNGLGYAPYVGAIFHDTSTPYTSAQPAPATEQLLGTTDNKIKILLFARIT